MTTGGGEEGGRFENLIQLIPVNATCDWRRYKGFLNGRPDHWKWSIHASGNRAYVRNLYTVRGHMYSY